MSTLPAAKRNALAGASFAFPTERKLPLEDARHVRNAVARFDQVKEVSDHERDAAWKRIVAAAKKHGVELMESGWRELGKTKG
jgi:acyl-CoA reductase-like NAD-dependent aldehyde dehydrogenase